MKNSVENTIKDYLKGKLPEAETLELEWQMERDPFLADAIEGYSRHPELLTKPKSVGSASFIKWTFALSFAFLLILVPNHSPLSEKQYEQEQWHYPTHNTENFRTNLEPIASAEIPEFILRPVKPELKRQLSSLKSSSITELNRLNMVHIPALGVELDKDIAVPDSRMPKIRFKTEYYHNLKVVVVDTTLGYSAGFYHNHVPAAFESRSNFQRSQKGYTPRKANTHYMERPLEHFARENYLECLKSLNSVSRRLPNNLNVSFYRALCLYNLGDYQAALKHFIKTQKHIEQGFAEESTWYQALCLDKLGKDKEALTLYQRILEQNGFYAFRAASRMAMKSKSE